MGKLPLTPDHGKVSPVGSDVEMEMGFEVRTRHSSQQGGSSTLSCRNRQSQGAIAHPGRDPATTPGSG